MTKLLIPLILLIVGVGGGVGAGLFLAPPPEEPETMAVGPCGDLPPDAHGAADDHAAPAEHVAEDDEDAEPTHEYVKLNNQFIVPVVEDGKVSSLVVMSLSVEVPVGISDSIFAAEPKLRDGFLEVMFNHANIGGFSGNFTSSANMRVLREELLRSAQAAVGSRVSDVLIIDFVRQDA